MRDLLLWNVARPYKKKKDDMSECFMGMCAHFDTAAPARECAQVYAPNFTVYVTTNPKKKQQKGYLNQYTIVTKI